MAIETHSAGTALIGDRVWSDDDGDGVQDPGEPGIGGVTVQLRGAGADGILFTADDSLANTTSTADGSYLFSGVAPGEYVVDVTDTGAVLSSYSLTSGPHSNSDPTAPITVIGGQIYDTADFGYNPPDAQDNTIGDLVWYDADNDGAQDGNESGIPNVSVASDQRHQWRWNLGPGWRR